MSRVHVQIMNQFHRKSHEYKAIKRYWKLIQQDSRKLSDKRFYRPTFRMHLTNKEILNKLLSYSQDLKHHYQLLLFHFQNKEPEKFFGLIEDNLNFSFCNDIYTGITEFLNQFKIWTVYFWTVGCVA